MYHINQDSYRQNRYIDKRYIDNRLKSRRQYVRIYTQAKNSQIIQNRPYPKPQKRLQEVDGYARTYSRELSKRRNIINKKSKRTEVFFVFVFLLISAYIIGYVYNNILRRETIEQFVIEIGSVASPTTFMAAVLRQERLYYATHDGILVLHVADGDRVRTGQLVASIQNTQMFSHYQQSLTNLDQNAVSFQRSRQGLVLNEQEIYNQSNYILRAVDRSAFNLSLGNVSEIYNLNNLVMQGLEVRNQLFFIGEDIMDYMASERNDILTSLSAARRSIYAGNSGIISLYFSGMENSNDSLYQTYHNLGEISNHSSIAGMSLVEGQPILRIIESNDWYINTYFPINYTENWHVNMNLTVYAHIYGSIVALDTVIASIETDNHQSFVSLRTNRHVLDFINNRNLSLQLSENPPMGYKVPRNAIVERGQFTIPEEFIVNINNLQVVTRDINGRSEVLAVFARLTSDGESRYILSETNGLRLGDTLISDLGSTFTINNIETVTGVYLTNRGYTSFVEISFDGNFSQNNYYFILDPNKNLNLRLHDRIVANALDIQGVQVVN